MQLHDSFFEVLAVDGLHLSLQFLNQRIDLLAVLFLEFQALIVIFELVEEVGHLELGFSLLEFFVGEGRFVLINSLAPYSNG